MPTVDVIKGAGSVAGYEVRCGKCAGRDLGATPPALALLVRRPGDTAWSLLPLRRYRSTGHQSGRAESFFWTRKDDHAPVAVRCHRCKRQLTLNPARLGRDRDPRAKGELLV